MFSSCHAVLGADIFPSQDSMHHSLSSRARSAVPLVVLSALAACGGGKTDSPVTPPVTPRAPDLVYAPCAARRPVWLATRDTGNSPWKRITPTAAGGFELSYPDGRGGLTLVDTIGGKVATRTYYLTVAEMRSIASAVDSSACRTPRTIRLSVTGIGTTDVAAVTVGMPRAIGLPGRSIDTTVTDSSVGVSDLIATRAKNAEPTRVVSTILRRGLTPEIGLAPIDFGGSEPFALDSVPVTIQNPTGSTSLSSAFQSAGPSGRSVSLDTRVTLLGTTVQSWARRIPVAQQRPGDLHYVSARNVSGASIGVWTTTADPVTFTFGPILTQPQIPTVGIHPLVQLFSQPEYNVVASATFSQVSGRSVSVTLSAAYLRSVPTLWELQFPNFSTIDGWDRAWDLERVYTTWSVIGAGGANVFDVTPRTLNQPYRSMELLGNTTLF